MDTFFALLQSLVGDDPRKLLTLPAGIVGLALLLKAVRGFIEKSKAAAIPAPALGPFAGLPPVAGVVTVPLTPATPANVVWPETGRQLDEAYEQASLAIMNALLAYGVAVRDITQHDAGVKK